MKYLASLIVAVSLAGFSWMARADHHDVFIHDVVLLDANTCAVELWIFENGQNGFEGTDRIEINGNLLAEIGDTEAATINAGGNTNAGDSILFGSDNFVGSTGLQPDVEFGDASCAQFVSGADFSFVTDDPTFGGPDATIDSVVMVSGFTTNTVVFRDTQDDLPGLVNLADETVVVSNNADASVTLGTATPNNGGCAISSGTSSRGGWILAGFVLFAVGFHRMFRFRKK